FPLISPCLISAVPKRVGTRIDSQSRNGDKCSAPDPAMMAVFFMAITSHKAEVMSTSTAEYSGK
ncbi:MAG TPA: hypothetical protein PLP86_01400, partial [Armatimonadota bacterium]|nr:hypothetical protein [Armatimonadota bacterium]